MPLQKQNINFNFQQGLNTKQDPNQIPFGQFLELENTIFTNGGLLQKRNGFQQIGTTLDTTYKFIDTFNGNLTAIGSSLSAYSSATQTFVNKGSTQQAQLSILSLIRSNSSQTQVDTATASNNLICVVYTDSLPSTAYKYAILDATTGQNIVAPTTIASASESPRVFYNAGYFIILYSQSANLKYIAINTSNPSSPNAAVTLITNYASGGTELAFDGVVVSNTLYVAYNGSDGGGAIRMTSLYSNLVRSTSATGTNVANAKAASIISICADSFISSSPIIWVAFYKTAGTTGYVLAVDQNITTVANVPTILAATSIISSGTVLNITCTAYNGSVNVFYEVSNNYSFDATIPTHFIDTVNVTQAGVVGSTSVLLRGVGLASKAFLMSNAPYFLAAYQSSYQPSYFMINGASGAMIGKLGYSNGGGYLTLGLPSVNILDTEASIGYLFKDLITPVNKNTNVAAGNQVNGIYAQLGINLSTWDFTVDGLNAVEIGQNLNVIGGIVRSYDGYTVSEQGFNLWPDLDLNSDGTYHGLSNANTGGGLKPLKYYYVAVYSWTDNQGNIFRSAPSVPVLEDLHSISPSGLTFTSTFSSGVSSITVSSSAGLFVGQRITDVTTGANIAANTYITYISGTTIGLSQPTAGASGSPDTLQTIDRITVTIKVPTLRLTSKTSNPVKIEVYRWSTDQQNYYLVTSVTSPTLNDTTADSVTITDTSNDVAILGNALLYTTGGVVENIGPPASSAMTLFKSRLFLIDAEDRNLLWYSKQVIEATPVEMSDLFTIFVAPTVSAQGNTGPMTALSSMDDKLIIFKREAIYYLTGTGPDNTGSNNDFSDPIFITATIGCTNQNSIVFIPSGLMFQSDKGIWLLGRDLSTQYIGAAVEAFNGSTVLSATTAPGTNQVRFALDTGEVLVYDYFYNQWNVFKGISQLSCTLFDGLHTFVNSYGQIFQENPGSYLDGSSPVLIHFLTGWFNLAGLKGYQRAYFFYFLAKYFSPHKLTIGLAYDYDPSIKQTSIITPDNFNGVLGSDPILGDGSPLGGNSQSEEWRVFLQQQKCESFQISLTESYDASKGAAAGAGFNMSGMDLIIGVKSNYPRLPAARSIG